MPNLPLNVTATITEACSISPAVATPLTYGPNNQTTTSFNIEFTSDATVGGSCVVNFAINEEVQTRNLIRTVTFNAEQAPTLVASLIGSGENIPASGQARVDVTATKRDDSNTPAVTFLNNIVSDGDPSCTATLDSANSQYITVAGTSTAVATYNVRPTSNPDAVSDCGVFIFNATEGSATGSRGFSRSINFLADIDSDGDNSLDSVDVDDDGDGLIELSTAAELNMMRNNLNGTGFDADNSDNDNTTGGDDTGCGGLPGITACNGYEQIANIDLNDLATVYPGPSTWEPVGTCGSAACDSGLGTQLFSGTFSGNNFTISNLFINVATRSFGVGFFRAISPDAELQNVHIRGGNITTDTSGAIGGLVGFGSDATISNSSVTLDAISGADNVGGLVGSGGSATISSSVATVGSISGAENVGGLVGWGDGATISSSVATAGSISGTDNVGGLVGNGVNTVTISSSVATVGSISGRNSVGGLLGDSFSSATISSSVATVGSISGTGLIGGLVGNGESATISSSMAITNSINAGSFLGGLISGLDTTTSSVTASYWDSRVSFANPPDNTAGSDQTTAALRTPTGFTGSANIYTTWANAWCNPTTGEFITDSSSSLAIDANRVWDLGTGAQYPAITCAQNVFSLADQRAAAARVLDGNSPIQ